MYGNVADESDKLAVVIANGPLTVSKRVLVTLMGGDSESVTVIDTVDVPVAVGVPAISPVPASMVAHDGSPVADHVYGVSPPLATRDALYGTVTTPWGSADVVIDIVAALTSSDRTSVTLSPVPPVTVKVTVDLPGVVGVPVITPVPGSMLAHPGRPFADHV